MCKQDLPERNVPDSSNKKNYINSSDEVDTSDEFLATNPNDNFEPFVAQGGGDRERHDWRNSRRNDWNDPQPGPSGYRQQPRPSTLQRQPSHYPETVQRSGGRCEMEMTPEQRAEQLIREAEASRARIHEVQGRRIQDLDLACDYVHSAMVDESYFLIGANLDATMVRKIQNGEYVDFARLIQRDRVQSEEDTRLEMVNRDGRMYCVPVETPASMSNVINSFARWEQAFRVYSNIYMQKYPQRSSELVQYNHLIHTASLSYTWENVYTYDKDFRLHMARHPYRSWAIILQQAWTVRLKDRLSSGNRTGENWGQNSRGNGNAGNGDRRARKDVCWRYNKGHCTYGNNCKFDHRCAICLKFGHGAHNCRRAGGNDYRERRHHDNRDQGHDKYYKKNEKSDGDPKSKSKV